MDLSLPALAPVGSDPAYFVDSPTERDVGGDAEAAVTLYGMRKHRRHETATVVAE